MILKGSAIRAQSNSPASSPVPSQGISPVVIEQFTYADTIIANIGEQREEDGQCIKPFLALGCSADLSSAVSSLRRR